MPEVSERRIRAIEERVDLLERVLAQHQREHARATGQAKPQKAARDAMRERVVGKQVRDARTQQQRDARAGMSRAQHQRERERRDLLRQQRTSWG